MNIEWSLSKDDVDRVHSVISENSAAAQERLDRIEWRSGRNVTRAQFWEAMVRVRLTTQVRDTPEGNLAQMPTRGGFPFRISEIENDSSPQTLKGILVHHGVGRHRERTSNDLAVNFARLNEPGRWNAILTLCNSLREQQCWRKERAVADEIQATFQGFGPKQSRNLLQRLALTRFEIPIDSRVTSWLNGELNFPFVVSPIGLQDRAVYHLILDGLRQLCEKANVFPCVLDAAVFAAGGA
jgi:hypothetical protein